MQLPVWCIRCCFSVTMSDLYLKPQVLVGLNSMIVRTAYIDHFFGYWAFFLGMSLHFASSELKRTLADADI